MLTEKKFIRLFVSIICILAAGLVIGCIVNISSLFTPVHFWDQWEMVKYVSEGGTFSLGYLMSPHNEHIISTSKILFYIDFWLFDYSNHFLVATIVALHLSVALALTLVMNAGRSTGDKLLWFSVFGALMLSLAQWENLTIGFQTQFGLTSLFAILACLFATRFAYASTVPWPALAGMAICTPLTIFSMGNGIALICPFVVVAVFARAHLSRVAIMLLMYAICLAVFVVQRNGSGASTQIDFNAITDLLRFYMTVLGGTFTGNIGRAVNIGAAIVMAFLMIFLFAAFVPWVRRQEVDSIVVICLAVSTFALASAAAVAIGRISLGPGAALTSRYATPRARPMNAESFLGFL